jgi:hypothetical protein
MFKTKKYFMDLKNYVYNFNLRRVLVKANFFSRTQVKGLQIIWDLV